MAKQARGLPDSFKLNVSASAIGKPVELGDYLDEDPPAPKPKPAPQAQPIQEPKAFVAPAPASPAPVAPTAPTPSLEAVGGQTPANRTEPFQMPARAAQAAPQALPRTPPRQAAPKPQRLSSSVPRKQINMAPETITMVEQLLDYVQTYGVQKDLKGSELFHGLVLALFEAKEHIDLSRVQPRGRWGTPTAQALPIALKTAFQKAIQTYYQEQQP